jgi:hypothetical protein
MEWSHAVRVNFLRRSGPIAKMIEEAVPKPFITMVELVETIDLRSCWRFDRFDKLTDRSVLKQPQSY